MEVQLRGLRGQRQWAVRVAHEDHGRGRGGRERGGGGKRRMEGADGEEQQRRPEDAGERRWRRWRHMMEK